MCASSRVKLEKHKIYVSQGKRANVHDRTYSYLAINAVYKLYVTYCETRLHADLMRPTTS